MRNKEFDLTNLCRSGFAAYAGAITLLFFSWSASGAPTVTVTNEGTSRDNVGDVATGWTSYLITLNADSGDRITEIDLGDAGDRNTSLINGIYGAFLQDWSPGKVSAVSTPIEPDQNGGAWGLDSHVLVPVSEQVALEAPYEDSNLANPGGSVPANDSVDSYGTGTFLHGIFGLTAAGAVPSVALAYVVIPSNSTGSFTLSAAEDPVTGGLSTLFNGITTVGPGFGPSVPEPASFVGIALASGGLLLGRRRRR